MSRVIKFRAWINSEMKFDVGVHPHLSELHDDGSITLSTSLDLFPVMQFTGLLDKNGKEIYEGDVVTVSDKYPCVVDFPQSYSFYEEMPAESLEVIGNIYENPELLPIKRIPADA